METTREILISDEDLDEYIESELDKLYNIQVI